jgi:hypothetical protein
MMADPAPVVLEVVPPTTGASEGLPAQRNSISCTLRKFGKVVDRAHWKTVVLEPSGGVRIHLKTEGDGAITTSSRSRRASATRTKAKHKGKEISAASRTSMTRVLKKRRWRLKGLAGQILRRRSFNVWKESINISELIKATSLLSTTRTTRSSKRA